MRYAAAIVAFIFLTACATTGSGGDSEIFRVSDPQGDDYGDGSVIYPSSGNVKAGDLDLIGFSAYSVEGGTRFVAEFARPVAVPTRQTVDTVGQSLDDFARYGFYAFNIDIYIDTDHKPGSGSVSTIPGRKSTVDPAFAWERAIVLTPDPGLARSELRRQLGRVEKREMKKEGQKLDEPTMDAMRAQVASNVEAYTFFPEKITVTGNRIAFLVPSSFLGGAAQADWGYTVIVSAADLIMRFDNQQRLIGEAPYSESLLILPVRQGRPLETLGTTREDAEDQPPILDMLVAAGADQKQILGDFASGRPAVLRGVIPR